MFDGILVQVRVDLEAGAIKSAVFDQAHYPSARSSVWPFELSVLLFSFWTHHLFRIASLQSLWCFVSAAMLEYLRASLAVARTRAARILTRSCWLGNWLHPP